MSFRVVDGTAKTSNDDYPGETMKTITIEVRGDRKEEADDTFYLDLFGNSGNSLFEVTSGAAEANGYRNQERT